MNRVNVLFLNKFREIGGSEVYLLELLEGLDRQRFRPVVALIGETCTQAHELLARHKVQVYGDLFRSEDLRRPTQAFEKLLSPQGQRSPADPTAILRLARILRQEKIHILFYLDKHAALNLAPLAAKLAGTPVVVGSFHTPGLQFSFLERMLFPATDRVTATSAFHQSYLIETVRIPQEKIVVINNGIHPGRLEAGCEPGIGRAALGLPAEAKVVGVVARLMPQKNLSLMLHAAARLAPRLPEVEFLFIGDGPERERLDNLVQELGLSNRVSFLGFRSDVPALLPLFDVSALSSDGEWFPYSLMESMLAGLPVVATDVGAVSELVAHEQTGLLTPPGDPDALAEALYRLLSNSDLRQRMGAAGKRRVLERFSAQGMVQRIENLLDELLQQKGVTLAA